MPSPKLVVIVGETASGKSALALLLAKQFNGEIMAADSWTVYPGFNIGTAKPSQQEQFAAPHHLLDVANPKQGFSAAAYKDLASQAIADIARRNKLPIMVGGSGLYVDAVLYDYSFLPPSQGKQRKQLEQKSLQQLLQIIKQQGYDLAGIDIRNKRRLVRLIESKGVRPTQKKLRSKTLLIGLKLPRPLLRKNIEARVELMFQHGLKHEVAELADKYGWDLEPMKGIGYREFKGYFSGQYSLAETKRKIIRSTLALAKKQRTWFKRHPQIVWIESPNQATGLVKKFLG